MKIVSIDTFTVSAVWKNWLIVKVNTDAGISGIGEGTLNGFIKTGEACVRELSPLVIGRDPRDVNALLKMLLGTVQDAGHVHRLAVAAIETACWDITGKHHGVPIYQLLGGAVRRSVRGYANGWYRVERTPEAFVAAAKNVVDLGLQALKLDPFGTQVGFMEASELKRSHDILAALRDAYPHVDILIDVHARFSPAEAVRIAEQLAPLGIYWWEEPTTREHPGSTLTVAQRSPIRVATGESFDSVSDFLQLGTRGAVSIWQPEPMSLGGILQTLKVAHLAEMQGCWIAPHQSGGPIATAVCLQLAACVPNFLIQEHFDPFNAPWTRDLVTWHPQIDASNGHLSIPTAPGLGLELNEEVALQHPYDPAAYLDTNQVGWEQRLGRR